MQILNLHFTLVLTTNFNFRTKHYIESGLKVYWEKINEFQTPIMIYKFHPNFEEEANIKNKDSIIAIELNDLSLIFFLIIYCFTFTLFIFILEILIFALKFINCQITLKFRLNVAIM